MATVLADSPNCSEIPTVIHLVASNVNSGSEGDEDDQTTITPVEDVLLEDTNGNTFRVIDSEHFQQSTKYYLINFYNPDDIENFNNIINNDNNDDNDSAIIRNVNDCKMANASDCVEQNIMYVSQDLRMVIRGNNLKSESGVCFFVVAYLNFQKSKFGLLF